MTSGNDKKGPPAPGARRPAPQPGARPTGPTSGGAAARPPAPSTAPAPGRPNPAPRPAPAAPNALSGRPAPAPRPAPRPPEDLDADAKTTAFNLADMGLDQDESTVSVEASSIRPSAARPAPAPAPAPRPAARPAPQPVDEEKTTAFNLADLPPEDDVRAAPSTFVGGASKPGAAVRGGAAPAKRNETLALAPSAVRARAPMPAPDEEKTSALSLDDIERIDAQPRPPQKPAALAPKAAGKLPVQIEESERTMAVPLDDAIAAIDAAPQKKPVAARIAPKAAEPAEGGDEKTTAMTEDDIARLEEMKRQKLAAKAAAAAAAAEGSPSGLRAAAGAQTPEVASPPKAKPVAKAAAGGAKAAFGKVDLAASEGFIGAVGYAFKHDALEQQMAEGKIAQAPLDSDKKTAGMRNLIIIGGALATLMVVFGIIW